jgi:hypothetical protein
MVLAIQACQDHTAQAVLGDAVLESDWADERVTLMLGSERLRCPGHYPLNGMVRSLERARNLSRKRARRPTRHWCRAVLAALLFGDWSQERWPLIEAVWIDPVAVVDVWWRPTNEVGVASGPGALFGINREVPPIRLAGVQLNTSSAGTRFELLRALLDQAVINADQFRRLLDAYSGPSEVET